MSETKTAVCLGNFDGVHIGHRRLLEQTVRTAQEKGLKPVAYTFSSHPLSLLGQGTLLLTLPDERRSLLMQAGVTPVEDDFAAVRDLSPQEFFEQVLLGRLHAGAVLCGAGHRFGKGASGDAKTLCALCAQAGISCVVLPSLTVEGRAVSSSWIRQCVTRGDMEKVALLLGRPFSVTGPVLHGKELGRKLGTPTVNQALPQGRVTPRHGVYAAFVLVDGARYAGAANVGLRPTVEGESLNVETHILDYQGDLYGRVITVELLRHLRDERRFADVGALQRQMFGDIGRVRRICMELRDTPMFSQPSCLSGDSVQDGPDRLTKAKTL